MGEDERLHSSLGKHFDLVLPTEHEGESGEEQDIRILLKPDATLRDLFGALRIKEEEMIENGDDPDKIRFHEEVIDQFGDEMHLEVMDLMEIEEAEPGQKGEKKDPRLDMKVREYFGDGDEGYTNDDVEVDLPIEFEKGKKIKSKKARYYRSELLLEKESESKPIYMN